MGNSKHPYNFKEIFETGQKNSTVLYQYWQQVILPSYGIRDLSKASDKLPAISGVVEAFRAKLNDEYLAGLWRKDLMPGLLWFNVSVFRNSSLPPEYRATSWSWAPVNCGVVYADLANEDICVQTY